MERNIVKEISHLQHGIQKYVSNGFDPRKLFNMTQFHIIIYLMKHDGEDVCQKDLEIETGLKKASITGALDSLVQKGYVYRVSSSEDKRKNYVRLTDTILAYRKDFNDREDLLNRKITENITPEELEIFYKVIDKVKDNIGTDRKDVITQ